MNLEIALDLGTVERSIWTLNCLAEVVLLLRLWRVGLWKTYRFFFLYIFVDLVRTGVFACLEIGTNAYGWVFVAFLPVDLICAALAILEIYGLVLRRYAGIGTMGRWAVTGGLVVSSLIAVVSLYPDMTNPAEQYPVLLYVFVFHRAVSSALLVFVLCITAFLVWFPVPLSRNVIVHALVFAVYFSGNALLLLIRNVAGNELTRLLSTINLGITTLCLFGWIALLTRETKAATLIFGHRWRGEDSDRLVRQLDAINSTLLRTGRK